MPRYEHDNWGDLTNTIFAKGIITAVYPEDDTADVTVEGYQNGSKTVLFYHCSDDAEERSNGAIEGAAVAFDEDDEVIVMIEADTGAPIRVIGFVDGIQSCCAFTEQYPYNEDEWVGLWAETTYCHDGWAYISCGSAVTTSFSFDGEHNFEFVRPGCGGHGSPMNGQVWYEQTFSEKIGLHPDTDYFFLVDLKNYEIAFSGGTGVNGTLSTTLFAVRLTRKSDGQVCSARVYFGLTNDATMLVPTLDASGSNQVSGVFYANILTILQYGYPTTTIDEWELSGLLIITYANANATNYNCSYQASVIAELNSIKVCSSYPDDAIPAYHDALAYGG